MAVLLYEDDTKEKFDFPNTKAITDIVLLINKNITEKVENQELSLDNNEVITISKEELYRIIKETKQEYQEYFSKFYREMTFDNFRDEILRYLKEYDFIREKEENYKVYPIVSKLTGYIPKQTKKEEKEIEQMNLFGGTYE